MQSKTDNSQPGPPLFVIARGHIFFYRVGLVNNLNNRVGLVNNLNKNNIKIRIISITIVLKCGQYCKLFPWEFRLLHWKDNFWIEVSNVFAGRLMFLQHLLLVFTGKHCCLFHWYISHWPLKVEIYQRTVSTDDFHSKSSLHWTTSLRFLTTIWFLQRYISPLIICRAMLSDFRKICNTLK